MSRADKTVHPYELVKHYYGGGMEESTVPGITLREHFAAMAMQGLCQSAQYHTGTTLHEWQLVSDAVSVADALIAELAKARP